MMLGVVKCWKTLCLRRYVLAFLIFLGSCNIYILRSNLSVAIVAMTSNHSVVQKDGTATYEREFNWNSKDKGRILSAFFYGYITTQIIGGWLGNRFGGVKIYGLGLSITSLLTLLTPIAASFNINAVIVLRVIEGICEGVTFPCVDAIWARWAPPDEMARLVSIGISGVFVGTVLAMPLCGLLAEYVGWEYTFYFTGIIGVMWSIAWFIFARDKPKDDPWISKEELKYLTDTINVVQKKVRYPWRKMLTSVSVWAVIISAFCEHWGYCTLLTQLPTFLNDIFEYDVKDAGILSALPYLLSTLIIPFSGYIIDVSRQWKTLNVTQIRKTSTCVSFVFQAIFMVLAAYATSPIMVIFLLSMGISAGAGAYTTVDVNFLDIAPQYASVLRGFSNTMLTVSGMIAPILSGYIVTNKSQDEWKIVFFISSAVYLFGAIFYGTFGTGEKQPWAITENTQYKNHAPKNVEND